MKKTVLFAAIFLMMFCSLDAARKKIAVLDLEDKSGEQHAGWRDVGKGMADMIATELVKGNKFVVIERQQLQKVIDEQKLGMSGAVTPQSAAKLGQLLGVGFIVTGGVTEFGVSQGGVNTGGIGRMLGLPVDVNAKSNSARVAIDVRLIDTTTGQIISAEKGAGEEVSTGIDLNMKAAPSVGFGNKGFDETVIGKATRKAIEEVTRKINDMESRLGWSARIMKVSGNQIFLNSGADDNEQMGRTIGIYRKGEELIDPDTGLSLGSDDTKLGTAKIVKIEKKYSIAETSVQGVKNDDLLKEEK